MSRCVPRKAKGARLAKRNGVVDVADRSLRRDKIDTEFGAALDA